MKSIFYTDIDEATGDEDRRRLGPPPPGRTPLPPRRKPQLHHPPRARPLRISRLGSASPAKAAEYYDAATVAAVFLTPGIVGPATADRRRHPHPRPLASCRLSPAEASAAVSALDGTLLQPAQKWPTGLTAHAAATAVAHASRHMTPQKTATSSSLPERHTASRLRNATPSSTPT